MDRNINSTTASSHSPLPWRLEQQRLNTHGIAYGIIDADGHMVAYHIDYSDSSRVGADFKLIVDAVNAYKDTSMAIETNGSRDYVAKSSLF